MTRETELRKILARAERRLRQVALEAPTQPYALDWLTVECQELADNLAGEAEAAMGLPAEADELRLLYAVAAEGWREEIAAREAAEAKVAEYEALRREAEARFGRVLGGAAG